MTIYSSIEEEKEAKRKISIREKKLKDEKGIRDRDKKIRQLETKLNIKTIKYVKMKELYNAKAKLAMEISKATNIISYDTDVLTLRKIGKIFYLDITGCNKNKCSVCQKRRKTTAHHLIPRRAIPINKPLAELRIRVCSECEEKIHPENSEIDGIKIIKRVSKKNERLVKLVRELENEKTGEYFEYLQNRTEMLERKVKLIPKELEHIPKKIHPAQKMMEGRIEECKQTIQAFMAIKRNRK